MEIMLKEIPDKKAVILKCINRAQAFVFPETESPANQPPPLYRVLPNTSVHQNLSVQTQDHPTARQQTNSSRQGSRQGSPHPRGRSQRKNSPARSADKSPARSPAANMVLFNTNNNKINIHINIIKGHILDNDLQKKSYKTFDPSKGQHPTVLFNLDTGCWFNLLPVKIAQTHNLKIQTIENKSLTVRDIQGNKLSILGRTLTHVKLTWSKKVMRLEAMVTSGPRNDEVVIGLGSM